MEYRIGDISKLFNISKEMIRYYEKQGAIVPERKEGNNYRTYSVWDIFAFMEMLKYREFNMSSRDIVHIKEGNFSQIFKEKLQSAEYALAEEIRHKKLLYKRVEEVKERIDCYELNEHNFWVKRIPKQYLFHLVSSEGDIYGDIDTSQPVRAKIFTSNMFPFLDPIIEFGTKDEWWFAISEKYEYLLDEELKSHAKILSAEYCLCTIVDMGEIGEFSHKCFVEALAYAEKKYCLCDQPVTGMILSRGYEDDKFVRRMEIHIPIKT